MRLPILIISLIHYSLGRLGELGSERVKDSDCCAFAPKIYGELPENNISKNYKIENNSLLSRAKDLVWRKALWLQACKSLCLLANGRSEANR